MSKKFQEIEISYDNAVITWCVHAVLARNLAIPYSLLLFSCLNACEIYHKTRKVLVNITVSREINEPKYMLITFSKLYPEPAK